MTVGFISSDFSAINNVLTPGGCGFYRCILPMLVCGHRAHAGRLAWDPIRGFGIRDTEDSGIFGFSTVMLKLIMHRSTPKMIELAHNLGQRIIVDVDDYYEGLTPANKAWAITHPEQNKTVNRDIYARVIELADTVTVSTPFLLEHYSKQRDNVVMVRNGVNLNQFTPVQQNVRPVIGWAGATSYRNNDLEQLREWLPDFLEENDLTFHHAGHSDDAPSFAEVTGVNPQRVRTSPLVPITHYADGFRFDVGLVPLNDIPFNHAKSNIKGLEYAAAGIPFVASDLPEYRVLHDEGVGALATTPLEWRTALTTLLDLQHRKREAKRQLAIVRERWAIEARANEWKEVLA